MRHDQRAMIGRPVVVVAVVAVVVVAVVAVAGLCCGPTFMHISRRSKGTVFLRAQMLGLSHGIGKTWENKV